MAEAQETRQRYRRLRAFNIAVGVLLAAEVLYIPALAGRQLPQRQRTLRR